MLFIRSKVTLHLLNSTRVLMSFSKHSSYFCHPHTALHLPSIVIYVYIIPFIEFFHTSLSKNKFLLQIFLELSSSLRLDIYKGMKIESISIIFTADTLFLIKICHDMKFMYFFEAKCTSFSETINKPHRRVKLNLTLLLGLF